MAAPKPLADERQLVEAAQRDPRRFAELYEQNFARVYAYVARRVGDRAAAEDVTLRLPPGTMIFNDDTGELMHDLKPSERVVIAKGGKGGLGNLHFKSSTNQAPRQFTPGEAGEEMLHQVGTSSSRSFKGGTAMGKTLMR